MSPRRNKSIYIFLGALLIIGIAIFVSKNWLLSYLSDQVFGGSQIILVDNAGVSNKKLINLQIFEDKKFQNLNDHVLYFDFNRVGQPVVRAGSGLQAPKWSPVYLGNANPLLRLEKEAATKETLK